MTTRPAVLVIGAINVDLVIRAPRLPGPGETVVGPRMDRHGGGKGANAAVAAARAGASVRLIGAVGADDTGASAIEELRCEGIDTSGVAILDEATGVALIVVDPAGENQIAVGAGANAALRPQDVEAGVAPVINQIGVVLISTEIPADAVAAAVNLAVAAGVRCVLNPAPMIDEVGALIELGVVLTPNEGELHELAASVGLPFELGTTGRAEALAALSGAAVVVTLGASGVLVADPDMPTVRHPAPPAKVIDTTGAGDTFNGVLAARLAAGDEIDDAVRVALAAASSSVEHLGARDGMPRLAG